MTKQPTIIQFDPDTYYHVNVMLILERVGLEAPKVIADLGSARKLMEDIENKKIIPDLAIVTDYLAKTHDDGRQIAEKLRSIKPDIKILAHLADKECPPWADILAVKSGTDTQQTLTNAIAKVLNIKLETVAGPIDLS